MPEQPSQSHSLRAFAEDKYSPAASLAMSRLRRCKRLAGRLLVSSDRKYEENIDLNLCVQPFSFCEMVILISLSQLLLWC